MLTTPYRATDGRMFKPPVARFSHRLAAYGDCLVWTGARNANGYGQMGLGGDRIVYTHRVAWALAEGFLEDDDLVLHRCDNPPCAARAHLFLGDHKANSDDKIAKGRNRRGQRRPTDPQKIAKILELSGHGLSSTQIAPNVGYSPVHVRKLLRDAREVR
jgi:hypothetical protein